MFVNLSRYDTFYSKAFSSELQHKALLNINYNLFSRFDVCFSFSANSFALRVSSIGELMVAFAKGSIVYAASFIPYC